MAKLDGRRAPLEEPSEPVEELERGVGPAEGPGELEEPGPDASRFLERSEGVDEPPDRVVVGRPLVGDTAPDLDGEEKPRQIGDPLRPAAHQPLSRDAIEGVVELDAVDIPGDETEPVDAPTGLVTTPRLGYMRLHGRNRANWFRRDAGRDERYDYLYDETELGEWRDRALAALPRVERLFVVLNNHFRGQALANALQLGSMIDGRRRAAPPSLLEMYPALRGVSSTPGQGNLLDGE